MFDVLLIVVLVFGSWVKSSRALDPLHNNNKNVDLVKFFNLTFSSSSSTNIL